MFGGYKIRVLAFTGSWLASNTGRANKLSRARL